MAIDAERRICAPVVASAFDPVLTFARSASGLALNVVFPHGREGRLADP